MTCQLAAERRQKLKGTTMSTTLTVLSNVPDVVADAPTATKLVLVATRVVSARIIVPTLAARLTASD